MIAIGCDHGGYELKELVKKHLEEKGQEVSINEKSGYCGCNIDFGRFLNAYWSYCELAFGYFA